ncbi:hypothetical protein IWX90DRAFT_436426 [Phyllosticta citrichinensis]|uniref:Uncharacterized protein n=1 Tax=Phyllosticta citrichinensis TaxID=1130410 RepID=A0ABR1XRF2_9PEZI
MSFLLSPRIVSPLFVMHPTLFHTLKTLPLLSCRWQSTWAPEPPAILRTAGKLLLDPLTSRRDVNPPLLDPLSFHTPPLDVFPALATPLTLLPQLQLDSRLLEDLPLDLLRKVADPGFKLHPLAHDALFDPVTHGLSSSDGAGEFRGGFDGEAKAFAFVAQPLAFLLECLSEFIGSPTNKRHVISFPPARLRLLSCRSENPFALRALHRGGARASEPLPGRCCSLSPGAGMIMDLRPWTLLVDGLRGPFASSPRPWMRLCVVNVSTKERNGWEAKSPFAGLRMSGVLEIIHGVALDDSQVCQLALFPDLTGVGVMVLRSPVGYEKHVGELTAPLSSS